MTHNIDNPLVSVVTVTYNAENDLTQTIESVIGQSYPYIEYLLIDGQSTDRTHEILKKYHSSIDKICIESDTGIYNAMNKAIDMAKGKWIIFINAGDKFYADDVVDKVFSEVIGPDIDFIYGDYVWQGNTNPTYIKSRPLELMWQKISFSHQSLFTKVALMREKKFDESFKIVSDYNFYFSSYMEGYKFMKMEFPISIFKAGGVSDRNFTKRTIERWKVVRKYRNDIMFHSFYVKQILKNYFERIKRWLLRIL